MTRLVTKQRLVDEVAADGARELAGNGADRPKDCAAGGPAGEGKNECGHGEIESNFAEMARQRRASSATLPLARSRG